MLNDVLKEVPGLLGRRFLMNAFFPSFLFWGLIIVVASAGQADFVNVLKEWNQLDITLKALQIVGFFSCVTVFSIILSNNFNTILRFYEGYWNFPLGRLLENNRRRWYQSHLRKLDFDNHKKELDEEIDKIKQELKKNTSQQQKKLRLEEQLKKLEEQLKKLQHQDNSGKLYETIYLYYPLPTQPEQVMPTRLGNILRNAELYSRDRYDIDAVLIWPRLYNLFPGHFIETIAEAKSSLDFMLVVSALSSIFALFSGIYLVIVKASGLLFLTCFWGGLFLAWLTYQSALGSALLYAQQIKAGFDLYRHELLKQMRLELPNTPLEEPELWEKIGQLLYHNIRVELQYKDTDAAKTQNSP
ncbi:hypothetical protein DP113_05615 [Brasilonema octagenarum UFV-E1]|uniref:Uncharacterized protein n=2 Tax=Brasilonema TaxID=383614 RepID=A0A856M9Q2_9CYAN|nr:MULTISPECIES: hypothetical protein [Brasilonema]NMF66134.1 hypothetical protein [Brasilonema octagenarum UFV-OR1]QDL07452.1 hypothetical protein DP114_05660 [Brasilonema sennae CENA114]QDL13814.1 hypothetical protein DP113_05615 [Brasilonema octagenarum UFV-E1]